MTDRTELLEAALDSLPEGIALLAREGQVVVLEPGRRGDYRIRERGPAGASGPSVLEVAAFASSRLGEKRLKRPASAAGRGAPVHVRVISWATMCRSLRASLCCATGWAGALGTAVVFHPAESLDALPHGECGEDRWRGSRARRISRNGWKRSSTTSRRAACRFGVLWITVDQAHESAQDARRGRLRGHAGKSGTGAGQRFAADRGDGALGRR